MRLKSICSFLFFLTLTTSVCADGINDPLNCDGQAASLMLEKPSTPVTWEVVKKLPYVKTGVEILSPGEPYPQMRIDVCIADNGSVDLQRVIVAPTFSFMVEQVFLADQNQITNVQGLEDFVFGKTSNFALDLSNDEHRKMLVRGITQDLVGIVSLYKSGPQWELSSNSVVVGKVTPGNPFADLKCPLGQSPSKSTVKMGTATLVADLCLFMGGGETTGYKIVGLSLTDTNSRLPAELQGKTFNWEGGALAEVLNYRWNHHNACDSFVLKLSNGAASYAATAPAMAGCGTVVPGAPERTYEDTDSRTMYRVQYGSLPREDGFLGQGHYFRLW